MYPFKVNVGLAMSRAERGARGGRHHGAGLLPLVCMIALPCARGFETCNTTLLRSAAFSLLDAAYDAQLQATVPVPGVSRHTVRCAGRARAECHVRLMSPPTVARCRGAQATFASSFTALARATAARARGLDDLRWARPRRVRPLVVPSADAPLLSSLSAPCSRASGLTASCPRWCSRLLRAARGRPAAPTRGLTSGRSAQVPHFECRAAHGH